MGLNDLMAGNKKGKTSPKKKETVEKDIEERKYKNIYLPVGAIDLLHKVTLMTKMENNDYSQGDAIYDGLKLLAKKKGIEA